MKKSLFAVLAVLMLALPIVAHAQVSCTQDPTITFDGYAFGTHMNVAPGGEVYLQYDIANNDNSCGCPDRQFQFSEVLIGVPGLPSPAYVAAAPSFGSPVTVTLKPRGCGSSFATVVAHVTSIGDGYAGGWVAFGTTPPFKYQLGFRVHSVNNLNTGTWMDYQYMNVQDYWGNTNQH